KPIVTIVHRDVARGDAAKYAQRDSQELEERLSHIELMGAITAPPPSIAPSYEPSPDGRPDGRRPK
ncbi:MAG: hypothetical protein ABIP39_06665, partial [Polyangiaceae bacterium]